MSNTGKPGCTIKKDCTIISGQGGVVKVEKPFDAMNNIVANLLLNITRYKMLCDNRHYLLSYFVLVYSLRLVDNFYMYI